MQVQKIFIITPLGNKNSEARKHADRMWNEVFVPVSEKISTNDLRKGKEERFSYAYFSHIAY